MGIIIGGALRAHQNRKRSCSISALQCITLSRNSNIGIKAASWHHKRSMKKAALGAA